MKETTIVEGKKSVKLNDPVLVVGLPGIGNVGKLVAEHLKKEFKPERIATLYSPHFPHQVMMLKSGGIRLVGNRFYLIRAKGAEHDIILLTGEVQAVTPEGQYEVNSRIVDYFVDTMHGKFIYTLGGYSISTGNTTKPKVYANVTRKEMVKGLKDSGIVFGKSKGMIWGSAGLILAFAKMRGIDGVCLMGETGFLDIDAAAAKSVLEVLAKQLGLEIDTKNLDHIIAKTAKALKEIENAATGFGAQTPPNSAEQRPAYIR